MKATRIITFLALIAIAFSVFTGCSVDPIQADIDNYLKNQMPALNAQNKEIVDGLNAVVGDNYVDDATLLAALTNDLVPKADDLLTKAIAIVPATPELVAVHDQFVLAAAAKSEALNQLQAALDASDADLVAEANKFLAAADTTSAAYTTAITDLGAKYGWKVN